MIELPEKFKNRTINRYGNLGIEWQIILKG